MAPQFNGADSWIQPESLVGFQVSGVPIPKTITVQPTINGTKEGTAGFFSRTSVQK